MKRKSAIQSRHPMVADMIHEEIVERKWTAESVSLVGGCSVSVAEQCINGPHRLTMIQAMILEKAFGISDGFIYRLQEICESKYPENGK